MFKVNQNNEYLVAVSGGPDSVFLLHNLIKQNPKKIIVLHVNYNFRSDSLYDQKIIEDICKKNNLILETLEIPKNTYDNFHLNFESWARKKRYDFFNSMSKKYNIKNLLIAHNFNDLIETYLLQKERKSLVEYWGLKKITNYQDMIVIRPMLKIKKSFILSWLEKNKINWAFDSTNLDEKYQRNKIRKKLVESSFSDLKKEIDLKNDELFELQQQAVFFVKNNVSANQIKIDKKYYSMTDEVKQRSLFYFFKFLNHIDLIENKSDTILEIKKTLDKSNKNFWKISIGNYYFVKDFDFCYLIEKEKFEFKKIIINTIDDLKNIYNISNWLEINNLILQDNHNFPYVVTNNFLEYKLNTTFQSKKMNRYLINNKIEYKKRYLKYVVFSEKDKKILNSIK